MTIIAFYRRDAEALYEREEYNEHNMLCSTRKNKANAHCKDTSTHTHARKHIQTCMHVRTNARTYSIQACGQEHTHNDLNPRFMIESSLKTTQRPPEYLPFCLSLTLLQTRSCTHIHARTNTYHETPCPLVRNDQVTLQHDSNHILRPAPQKSKLHKRPTLPNERRNDLFKLRTIYHLPIHTVQHVSRL